MAIDFGAMLGDDAKRNLLQQRIQSFAAEGYQHTLNKAVAEASGNTEAAAQADEAINILSEAITVHEAELAALPAPAEVVE